MKMQGKGVSLKNGASVWVRTVRPSEAGRVLKFLKSVHHKNELLDFTSKELEEIKTRAVRRAIKDFELSKRQIMFGVYNENKLIGLCTISRVSAREKHSHRAALFIALDEGFRGAGLGAALMKLAFDFAAKVAYEQFETTVTDGNTAAFILCTEYGFKAMCRFPHASKSMKGTYQDSILLIKYLNNYET